MSTHLGETVMNDLADGVLAPAARDAAARHLAACEDCRTRLESLSELRAVLGSLRRDIDPPADLLDAIHAAMDAAPGPGRADLVPRGERGWTLRPAILAVAAVLLMLATSFVTILVLRPDPVAVATEPPAERAVRLAAAHPLERSWQEAIVELQRELSAHDSALAPETRRVIEANLKIIDDALAEARAALLADPANAALAEVLRSGYERKLDVLRSAADHVRPAS
jgi:hypothetical protein